VAEVRDGGVRTFDVTPSDVGVTTAQPAQLKGGDAAHNAAAIRRVLAGEAGPFRDIVLLNAAAALVVAGKATDLRAGAALAARSIDSGAAAERLERLVRVSGEDA
jgi:anthranilate phosphoribosyltransferase